MSAVAQTPAPTIAPAPPGAAAMPSRIGRVLIVLRKLIDYGMQLATAVRQHAAAPGLASFAKPFATADLTTILARITAGLRRAAALEARLCQRAARGRDLTPSSPRLPAPYQPRLPPQLAPPDSQPAAPADDPRLARLPTEEEIAAEVRRRPVGAVIVDICRDLAILPSHPLWRQIQNAINQHGGSLSGFLNRSDNRPFDCGYGEHANLAWPTAPPRPLALATGPPAPG